MVKENKEGICKLSDDLKCWRSERPDEWTMDRFIRKAEYMEKLIDKLNSRKV